MFRVTIGKSDRVGFGVYPLHVFVFPWALVPLLSIPDKRGLNEGMKGFP